MVWCAITACLCGALCVGPAFADELTDAQDALTQAEERLTTLTADYESIQKDIEESQKLIDATLAEVYAAQSAVIAGQEALSASVAYSYKVDNLSMLTLLFDSRSVSELISNVRYLNFVQSSQAREIAEQKERKAVLDATLEELDRQRDEQERQLQSAEDKRAEAENIVSTASSKVEKIQDDLAEAEAQRLEELRLAAEALEQQKQQEEQDLSDNWNTNTETETTPPPAPNPSIPDVAPSQPADPSTGWYSGVASAYGGSTDPNTPNPGYTATGAICDDYSMGVAIPMSWPNYRSYLGKSVEISYGGKTVVAVVNDVGYMGGGARSLDLQPGVFKAFGFNSCNDWGVRTVSYRFL